MNANGVVVGETSCIAMEDLVFRWSEETGMQQLANYPGGYRIDGGSINKQGNIAASFNYNWSQEFSSPIIWTPSNTRIDLAPGTPGNPTDINDRNEVVGVRYQGRVSLPFRWTASTGLVAMLALGKRRPVAINQEGDVAAISTDGTAILFKSGARTVIGGFLAQDMNARREVVGATGTWPTTTAAIWSPAKGIRSLGTLGGAMSYAYGINNEGEVVGASTTSSGEVHAFYWSLSRGIVDLGPGEAYGISDKGHMVGMAPTGVLPPWGGEVWHATLWRGTGGMSPSTVTARAVTVAQGREAMCFNDPANWQLKSAMFRCISGQR